MHGLVPLRSGDARNREESEFRQMSVSPILLLHMVAGTVGLLSGTVAICVRKGSRIHARAGTVFSISMLTLAASGVSLAVAKSQMGNVFGGLLTFYMIATAWLAGRRREKKTELLDWAGLVVALAVGVSCLMYGYRVANDPADANDGVPAGMDFFLGSVVLVAAAGDIHTLARGGLTGVPRVARHLWRMCFGLFIASGSFFMGRQRIFPEAIRNSGVLILLTIFPLILLVFWLVRVRFGNAYLGLPLAADSPRE
jgi:uncharacterized membrane protein